MRRPAARIAAALACLPLLASLSGPAHGGGAEPYQFRWANPTPQGNGLYGIVYQDNVIGYAVGDRGTVLRTSDGGVTWVDLTDQEAFSADLRDVLLLGPGDLLAVGSPPGVFRSPDGGGSWSAVPNPSTTVLHDVEVIDGDTLSAIGEEAQVLRSVDGGATWTLTPPPEPGFYTLRDQFWWNGSEGYVVGDLVTRKTMDGGLTWSPLPGIDDPSFRFFTGVHFIDPMNGWILEHFTTYRTTDGGASWFTRHGFPDAPVYQSDQVVLTASHRMVTTDLEGAGIWETFDDGLTWTNLYQRFNTRGYTDIDRRADGTLVACSTFGDLLRSGDGGATWINATEAPGDGERQNVTALERLPGGRLFAGGRGELWLESNDDGLTWEIPDADPGIGIVYDIAFLDDQFGLAGGYVPIGQSRIARTTDGGATWTQHPFTGSYVGYPRGIALPDPDTCYVVTSGGSEHNHVFRSHDGGVTWEMSVLATAGTFELASIFFLDARTGYVGGGDFSMVATIWKTVDGGDSWSMVGETGLGQARIAVMHWWDENHGLAGNYHGLWRTTDGGGFWTQVVSDAVFTLDFRPDGHGVAGSYFYPWVRVTGDSGATWTRVDFPWPGAAECVAAVASGFYVGSAGSVILHGVSSTATAVAGGGEPGIVPDPGARDGLLQVRPNPSAGAVSIRFQNPLAGTCLMRVVDVRGREVAVLRRRVESGTASIDWDGGGQAGGVYFVDLRLPSGERRLGRLLLTP